jgi:hypothetical protein
MKDEATRNRFVELRALGWSYDRIAKELTVSKQSLISWSKQLSLEISNLRAIRLESIQEQYSLLKSQRIEILGQKLKAIKDELDRRNLTDIPTEKLFNILFKGLAILERDVPELTFQDESLAPEWRLDVNSIQSWKA